MTTDRKAENARQRAKYRASPDRQKAHARNYYWKHRDEVLAKARNKLKTPEGRATRARYRQTAKRKRRAK